MICHLNNLIMISHLNNLTIISHLNNSVIHSKPSVRGFTLLQWHEPINAELINVHLFGGFWEKRGFLCPPSPRPAGGADDPGAVTPSLALCHPLRDIQERPAPPQAVISAPKLSRPPSPSDSEPGIENWKLKFAAPLSPAVPSSLWESTSGLICSGAKEGGK